MTTTVERPATVGRDGFGQLLHAEWTKLRSVRRWVIGLFVAVGVTVLFSYVGAAGSSTDANQHPELLDPVGPDGDRVQDTLHFVHQPLAGDGSITARVASQVDSQEWAKAGVMVRASTEPGSQYAAMLVTPGHGVRLHANYDTEGEAGSDGTAPRWLRLTRAGDTVTGYESADGSSWSEVGTVGLDGLPPTVEVGLFVTSPGQAEIERSFSSISVGESPTLGTATFDNVRIEPVQSRSPAAWQDHDTSNGFADAEPVSEVDGVFTITGSGDMGPSRADDDLTQLGLLGVFAGQIAVVALAVLFITAEYKRGMIRTTFAASPRRGRVLAAKAIVIGTVTFVVGLVGGLVSFLVAMPVLRAGGFGPPAFEVPTLTDWRVLRAIAGVGVYLALIAVLSLGIGAVLRRSAAAIAILVMLLILPFLFQGGLPLTAAQWLIRSTPIAGMAMLRTTEPDPLAALTDATSMATPIGGLGVMVAYAGAALGLAYWRLRRQDA
jgi:ABC-type transport system involved in multi-copper enzyme maturation permease subunit